MSDVSEIINWRRLDGDTTTSGQPSEEQLFQLRDLGIINIINLGPHDNDGALEDETKSVSDLGMNYIYIPVDFENPTDADFNAFCAAMDKTNGSKTHIHCIYNARVSAFFYRYAKTNTRFDEQEMFEIMDGIWRPGGNWACFIGDESAVEKPNRFLGYEY